MRISGTPFPAKSTDDTVGRWPFYSDRPVGGKVAFNLSRTIRLRSDRNQPLFHGFVEKGQLAVDLVGFADALDLVKYV
jgi:hypothetical protein